MVRLDPVLRRVALALILLVPLPAAAQPSGITPIELPASDPPPPPPAAMPDQLDDAEAARAAYNQVEAEKAQARIRAQEAERAALAEAEAERRRANEQVLRAHDAAVARAAAEAAAERARWEAATVPCPSDPSRRCVPPPPKAK